MTVSSTKPFCPNGGTYTSQIGLLPRPSVSCPPEATTCPHRPSDFLFKSSTHLSKPTVASSKSRRGRVIGLGRPPPSSNSNMTTSSPTYALCSADVFRLAITVTIHATHAHCNLPGNIGHLSCLTQPTATCPFRLTTALGTTLSAGITTAVCSPTDSFGGKRP